jgi:hypothetical protein
LDVHLTSCHDWDHLGSACSSGKDASTKMKLWLQLRRHLQCGLVTHQKLKVIREAKTSTDIKSIWSFMCLCNLFCTHIKDFILNAADHWSNSQGMTPDTNQALFWNQCSCHSTCCKSAHLQTSYGISSVRHRVLNNHRSIYQRSRYIQRTQN